MTPVDATILDRARGAGRWYGQVAGPRSSRDRVRQDLLWRCKLCKLCTASSASSASVGREPDLCTELDRVGTDMQDSTRKSRARAASRKGVGSCQAHGYCFCRRAAYVVQAVGTQEAGLASVVYPDGVGQVVTLTDESP
jgi:succinate dehydrogenase/fumarate reductase-like Fe-S protein